MSAVLAVGCQSPPTETAPTLTPARSALLPGMRQPLRLEGLQASDIAWSASGGQLSQDGTSAFFIAPEQPGEYTIRAVSRSIPGRSAAAVLTVRGADPTALVLDAPPSPGALAGRRGPVRFEARPDGEKGAHARFTLEGQEHEAGARSETGEPVVLEVHVLDETHGQLTFAGRTLDGDGALTPEEEQTLRALAASELFPGLAMVPLDVACAAAVEPRVTAALLMPWQAVQKYLTAARATQAKAFASASACRYFTPVDAPPSDPRPEPDLPLLSNGQYVPAAYGYLPLDTEGDLPSSTTAIKKLEADENVFGPGGAMCRGACGVGCAENNCGKPHDEWRCVQKDGHNTGEKQLWVRYTCGEHPGCIEHDACYDNCKLVLGLDSWDTAVCMRGCDLQAAEGYGVGQGLEWAQGYGPYTHEKNYDYSYGDPVPDDKTCPLSFTFVAEPSSGMAPHATVLRWEGLLTTGRGTAPCRLDPGDGTPPLTIDPCPANGERSHTYAVPSDMREPSGVYTATLQRIGAATTASTDVQATWSFSATTQVGTMPLATSFAWDGFALVSKPLTCTLDFGDGSQPVVVPDCAGKPAVAHTYAHSGTYQAVLTVEGEARTVSKTLSIEVKPESTPTDCSGIVGIPSWSGTAQFSYSASASSSARTVQLDASGNLQGTLTVFVQGPGGISFLASNPTGTVSVHDLALSLAPNADNPIYDVQGSGDPVPPTGAPDTGSNFILSFDLANCRYNVHVQALVHATAQQGSHTSAADYWVVSFQTPWLPIPAGMTLSDAGAYTAHSEDFILGQPGLIQYYLVQNQDLIDMLGEAGLGTAQVSWQLTPSQ